MSHHLHKTVFMISILVIFGCRKITNNEGMQESDVDFLDQSSSNENREVNEQNIPPEKCEALMFYVPDKSQDQYGNSVCQCSKLSRKYSTIPKEIWTIFPRIEFVLVPSGRFVMGESDTGRKTLEMEIPPHEVEITSSFYLSKYEITQVQWQQIMTKNNTDSRTANHIPVTGVSWFECKMFCKITGLRLPSEAQWELACRGGTSARYFFDESTDNLQSYAWFRINSNKTVQAIGQKDPNPYGLYDVLGNVAEWVEDSWNPNFYKSPRAIEKDPICDTKSDGRTVRGGAFWAEAWRCRPASRYGGNASSGLDSIGFRPCIPSNLALARMRGSNDGSKG